MAFPPDRASMAPGRADAGEPSSLYRHLHSLYLGVDRLGADDPGGHRFLTGQATTTAAPPRLATDLSRSAQRHGDGESTLGGLLVLGIHLLRRQGHRRDRRVEV